MTLKYEGRLKVKSVTATTDAAPTVESKTLAEATVGMIMGTDGLAYAVAYKDNLPDGMTAAGMLAYKNGSNGLVIALADEASNMNWSTANGTSGAAAHTPAVSGKSWMLPSEDDWCNIFSANGGDSGSYTGLNTALTAAGGNGLQTDKNYWTSTPEEDEDDKALFLYFINDGAYFYQEDKAELKVVRAVMAF